MNCQLLLLSPLLLAIGCQAYEVRLPPPPTEEQIIEMSKAGKPADEIIHEISKAMGVYVLRTKDVIRLHQAGVDEKVIDYMFRDREVGHPRARGALLLLLVPALSIRLVSVRLLGAVLVRVPAPRMDRGNTSPSERDEIVADAETSVGRSPEERFRSLQRLIGSIWSHLSEEEMPTDAGFAVKDRGPVTGRRARGQARAWIAEYAGG